MSEELLQRNLLDDPEKIGKWDFYNIGNTTVKALKEHGIIRNVDYGSLERKKVDGILVQRKNVIAIIEYKKPSEFKSLKQKDKAIKQELDVAKILKSKIYIVTDTKEAIWINPLTGNKIKSENKKDIIDLFDKNNDKLPDLIEKIINSINERNDCIKPKKMVNPKDLAKQIWQDVWSVSGATPENCLYTFVELFIFKYLSDLGILKGSYSFNTLMKSYETDTPEEVLENYAKIIRPKIKEYFPHSEIDKTTIINGTIFVSKDQKAVAGYSTVFKKVLKKFQDYGKLEHIDYDFKSQLFESFLKESISKKNWGQFFTPLKVVRAIVEMAKDDIKPNIKICDPACGVGKFLLEPIKSRLNEFYKADKNGINKSITICGFDKGFDKDEQKTIILAKANMLIYFSDLIKENPSLTKEFSKLFNESFILKTNSILGTLSEPVNDEYDLILTNPPYVTSGSSNLKEEIKKSGLSSEYKINAMGVEGLFMEWIIKSLKPGGKAFIVVPDGIFNRQNDKNLREYIIKQCYLDAVISLPLNTFFTTNKKTYILAITKKFNISDVQENPVFTYLVSEIGESRDVYRFDIEQNDLVEAIELYSFFKGNKTGFEKINSDKRCKILSIKFFNDNISNSWIIDKQWSEEEKIELGIAEQKEKLSLQDFSTYVNDIATTISGFVEEINEISEKKNEIKFIEIPLNDIFIIDKGFAKYTKKYGNANKGEYPVFSASNNAPLTYINTYDYDGEYLTWSTNGFAGYIKKIVGKFSINGDRGILQLRNTVKNINVNYIKYVLEPILRNLAKGRKGEKGEDEFTKVYPSMLNDIKIAIPIDKNGNYDIKTQNNIVEKYSFINEIKENVLKYKKEIAELEIEIDDNTCNYMEVLITNKKYFDLNRGKRITKKEIDKNKGNIPVYSSSKKEDSVLGYIDEQYLLKNNLILCQKPSILFNLDGSVGYCFLRKNKKYSYIDVVASLLPKDKKINMDYTLYKLREAITKTGANYQTKLYFNKINNYQISIRYPIDENGDISIKKQNEIADKFKKVEFIKNNISMELEKILNANISFE